MSISTQDNKVTYNCNGSLQDFGFTFPIIDDTDLKVIYTDADGIEHVLTVITEYTITPTVVGDYSSGGTVSTVATYLSGTKITLLRETPYTQNADYVENDTFPAEAHEDVADKVTMLAQQVYELAARALKFPASDTVAPNDLPTAVNRLSRYLFCDSSGQITTAALLDASLVTVTAFSEVLLADGNAADWLTTLGFSAFVQTLLAAADGDAFNALTGAFDLTVNSLADALGDLDDISDGTIYQRTPNRGYIKLSLTNYDNQSAPQVTDGSVVEVGGTLFTVSGDTTPTGSPTADSFNYIYMENDGDIVVDTTAPTWDDDEQQWLNGTDRAIAGYYLDGSNYELKWIYNNQHSGPVGRELSVPLVGFSPSTARPIGLVVDTLNGATAILGVTIKESVVTSFFSYATYGAADISVALYTSVRNSASETLMAVNNHSSSGGMTDATIINPLIDNDANKYYVRIVGQPAATGEVRGVVIYYTEVMRT